MFVYSRYVLCIVVAVSSSDAVWLANYVIVCYDVIYISFFHSSLFFRIFSLLHSRPSVFLSLFSICLRYLGITQRILWAILVCGVSDYDCDVHFISLSIDVAIQ